MKIKSIVLLLSVLAFVSCATMDTGRHYDEGSRCFISKHPNLKVQIKDKDAREAKTNIKATHAYGFDTNDGGILIEIKKIQHHNWDYFYSDEAIIKNIRGAVCLGTKPIKDKNWVKMAYFTEEKNIQIGYFRRQDRYLIWVTYIEHHPEQSANIKAYKKTLEIPQGLQDQIDRQFAVADAKLEIL